MVQILATQEGRVQQAQRNQSVTSVNGNNRQVIPVGVKAIEQTGNILFQPEYTDKIQQSIINIQESLKLNPYNLTLTKDSYSMLRKSQTNLIDLIKYYDGDPDYYYEGYTAVYSDTYGKKTTGFGHYYPRKAIKSQEEAYNTLYNDLSGVNKTLENIIGKNKYYSLPLSIREALIDFAFNKGPNKISERSELMNAINQNNYPKIVANIYYYTSGSNNTRGNHEEAGLYRRSLSRAILAARDLTGTDLEKAKQEIQVLYQNARRFYIEKAPDKNVGDLDNVYKCFKNEPISSGIRYADNFKITIEQGKTLYSAAKEAYLAQNDTSVTLQEYREAFYKINNNPETIKAGEELIAPSIKNVRAILNKTPEAVIDEQGQDALSPDSNGQGEQDTISSDIKNDSIQIKPDVAGEISDNSKLLSGGILSATVGAGIGILAGITKKVKNPKLAGLAVLGAGIGYGIYKLAKFFGLGKSQDDEPRTAFQKMLKNPDVKITSDGNFEIVSLEHKIERGNTIYGLSKEYQISQDIICENNGISNPDRIQQGQVIKIEKIGYKVKSGENLASIAEKLGLNEAILRDVNEIDEENDVKKNQIIELPGFVHTVKRGETLFAIAKKVGVTIAKLKEINNLTTDMIHPGDKIKVIYNNSDYDVPDNMKTEVIDEDTNERVELTNVSNKFKKDFERDDVLPEVKEILKEKRRVNGRVVPNRKVFTAQNLNVRVQSDKLKGKIIIVNAGHGYSEAVNPDRGTLAQCDMNDEWLVNANNAVRLAKQLCAHGARVIYLQGKRDLITGDVKKPENKADMFISVHANSAGAGAKDRTMFFYRDRNVSGAPRENSIKFAKIAEKHFDKWIKENESIARNDRFYLNGRQDYAQLSTNDSRTGVLKAPLNQQKIPGIIWEVGFMSAKKGQERLTNLGLMDNYAKVMAESVIEYFN